jgi:hypothetical protein
MTEHANGDESVMMNICNEEKDKVEDMHIY